MIRQNAIQLIRPYRYAGIWVFDDENKGLMREPFVAGVPAMIDALVRHVPGAENGFCLYFSAEIFPGAQFRVDRTTAEAGGWWYTGELNGEIFQGWLCPALFCYFDEAPLQLHVRAEAERR